ncbi:hypothetical protein [Plantibacter sp. VKM Ac-2876]|jgi:hypothetical protein|uniref:hypothetical protein n=1 Tax=Plantibacter sp. VKM Ac-2876 TaxID=2783826 RepID=UPI00188B20BC|nr:hypothetical protein [Plantibacter sp. VKM Ac-2876]MBF4565404.1 hypothetical protein [Plantibacter sp. VKM Ac-2876]
MAIGDKAAAKGLAVYPPNQKVGKGYENDNQRGDELADEMTARAAADLTKFDKDLLKVQQADPGHLPGRVWVSWV